MTSSQWTPASPFLVDLSDEAREGLKVFCYDRAVLLAELTPFLIGALQNTLRLPDRDLQLLAKAKAEADLSLSFAEREHQLRYLPSECLIELDLSLSYTKQCALVRPPGWTWQLN